MGGRGARFGTSEKGKKYGTEYTTIYEFDKVKIIKYNGNKGNAKAPYDSMVRGRIYAILNKNNDIQYITQHPRRKRADQIDLGGRAHVVNGEPLVEHIHIGYEHQGSTVRVLNEAEKRLVNRIVTKWKEVRDTEEVVNNLKEWHNKYGK